MTEIGRRQLLKAATALGAGGAAGLAFGGLVAGGLGTASAASESGPNGRLIPFHGAHQGGIITPAAQSTVHAAFDLTARNRSELAELLETITGRARFLAGGGVPPDLGISAPPSDSGTLGPVVVPDGLTVTVALGASAYDSRFGLASQKPIRLRPMTPFPDDDLNPSICGGDLLLTLGADHQDTVLHALRDITRHARGGMQLRWRLDGFTAPPRPSGVPRNLFGFKDGIANPDVTNAGAMNALVWTRHGSGEPASAVGGSYQVVRIIRMLIEFWDRVTIGEQERMFGRRKDTGAPLSGQHEQDTPDYANDPLGSTIPLDAHIRLANPRTAQSANSQILRRGYSYDNGIDANGNLDTGLVFTCFQQDLERQFVAVQNRLAGEPLVDYVLPVGGGYFFALPGVTGPSDRYGRALLAT